jgi:hypothetical protein
VPAWPGAKKIAMEFSALNRRGRLLEDTFGTKTRYWLIAKSEKSYKAFRRFVESLASSLRLL